MERMVEGMPGFCFWPEGCEKGETVGCTGMGRVKRCLTTKKINK